MATRERPSRLLIAAGFLAIGLLAGFGVSRVVGGPSNFAQVALEAEIGNAASTRLALESLREGNVQQATETLETALSLNVVVIDEFIRELRPSDPDKGVKFLRTIARYRAAYPYSSIEPAADQNVARILSHYAPQ